MTAGLMVTGMLLEKKAANALFQEVGLTPRASARLQSSAPGVLGWLRKRQGGLWVGGTLSLFDDSVRFSPNDLNKLIQTGDLSFILPWSAISAVVWRPGILTGIVELTHGERVEAVRCFGSRSLAGRMETLRQAGSSGLRFAAAEDDAEGV